MKKIKKQDFNITVGAVVPKSGSSLKNRTGSWRVFKPVLLKKRCTGCGICAQYCPDVCIKIRNKKAAINYDYCKGCAICAKECPMKSIIMQKEERQGR